MARRLFNGRAFSEDGWPYVDEGSCTWVIVPGTNPPVHLEIQSGPPAAIMGAWAADWNAYVEPLRDADSASWTPGNSVPTSNHPGATAEDLNWESHTYGVSMSGFNAAQQATMAEMEAFYEGNMFWAQRWYPASYVDPMHSQMGYDTYDTDNDRPFPKVFDFIARKIRADGFSTFRRGNAPVQQYGLTVENFATVMGNVAGVDYRALLPAYRTACALAGCAGNLNRLAMFGAQLGHESVGMKYFEEIWGPTAAQNSYQGRMGNTRPGDGYLFRGRGPIQVTGADNYRALSAWAFGHGLVPTATYFYDNPDELSSVQYGFLGAVWYWTVARSQINAMCDAGDIVGVTKAINGGTNGLDDRTARWNRCKSMGLAALDVTGSTSPEGEDELSAEAERMIREMYDEYNKSKRGPSRGFFAPDANPVDSPLGFLWNIDGNVWNQEVTWAYLFGVQRAEQLVNSVAQNGVAPASWAGQLTDAQGAWLAEWGQQWCLGLISFRAAIQKAFRTAGAAPVAQGVPVDTSLTERQAQDIANRAAAAVASQVPAQVQAAVNSALPAPALAPASVELAVTDPDEADDIAGRMNAIWLKVKEHAKTIAAFVAGIVVSAVVKLINGEEPWPQNGNDWLKLAIASFGPAIATWLARNKITQDQLDKDPHVIGGVVVDVPPPPPAAPPSTGGYQAPY